MRRFWLSWTATFVIISTVTAQPQQGQVPLGGQSIDPNQNRLDGLLLRWEQEMANVQTIVAQCTRTNLDKTFQSTEVFQGTARYMKPNLAMLELQMKEKPQVFEKYVCTGTFLYAYVPQSRIVRVYEMPAPRPGQVSDDNFMSFLFGMKAEEARRRYELKLVKEDKWYVYIKILPRFPADKADFHEARLVLNNQTFLPRELWFEQPNGNEVKWDIPKIDGGTPLNRTDFTSPALPQGWNMVRMPREQGAAQAVPPRIVRPNQ